MLLENDISRPAILEHLPSPTQNPRLMTLDVQLEQVYRFRSWQQLIELRGYYLKKLSPIPGSTFAPPLLRSDSHGCTSIASPEASESAA